MRTTRHEFVLIAFVLAAAVSAAPIGVGAARAASYMVKNGAIAASLTGKAGDAINGRKVAINRRHKRWSMWFNSTQREEPYLGLTSPDRPGNRVFHFGGPGDRCCMAVVSSCREMLG